MKELDTLVINANLLRPRRVVSNATRRINMTAKHSNATDVNSEQPGGIISRFTKILTILGYDFPVTNVNMLQLVSAI